MSELGASGDDPRRNPRVEEELRDADLAAAPAVPRTREGLSLWVGLGALAIVAVLLFLWLSSNRRHAQEGDLVEAERSAPATASAPFAAPLPAAPLVAAGPITNVPAPQFTTNNSVPTPPRPSSPPMMMSVPMTAGSAAPATLGAAPTLEQRRRAPALVVDLGAAEPASARAGAPVGVAPPNPALVSLTAMQDAQAAANSVSAEERFTARVSGADNAPARATRMRNLGQLVPEGATIPATLETALDSDLPGYARAVVSRDVRAFDGRAVLIPRGSRVIGQYKAATALGAARIFVIWTRLIRPDGVSVQLASPAADDLGRAGLTGKVDSHFFTRFGGAILLSVLNAGIAAASSLQTSAQVYIGSSNDAQSVAAAAIAKDGSRPPTIRTPQGAAVNIFVARDLDFSTVGPAR